MSQPAIRVNGLSKRYRIGLPKTYKTLRDNISGLLRSPSRLFRLKTPEEYIWALKNVNIEIGHGEFVGIIGRNGAGKSTLLKILTRITEPTEGYVEIHGRVSALLEVGTGFHNELTGRENIFLNGSILGMKKNEINKTFEEIVEFSGVSKFIDTQVKHYSSGMRVRLAFSVAAHLQPDILFIDEVLAVGDLEFQQKCLKKMKEVTAQGRTVLLVTHNLAAIKEMTQRCILLNNGKVDFLGPVEEALARYSSGVFIEGEQTDTGLGWSPLNIATCDGNPTLSSDQAFTAEALLDLQQDFASGTLLFAIKDAADRFVIQEKITASELGGPFTTGRHRIKVELPVLWLAPGSYVSRFRFVGHTKSGEGKGFISPQIIFTVSGSFRGRDHSKVMLHPRVQWNHAYYPSFKDSIHLVDS